MPKKGKSSNPHPVPDSVWVELCQPDMDYQRDAVLPTQIPISKVKDGLLKLLKERESKRFSKVERLSIFYQGELLPDDVTFASQGIWDGSILVLEVARKKFYDPL